VIYPMWDIKKSENSFKY